MENHCVVYDESSRDRVIGDHGGCVTVVPFNSLRIVLEQQIRLSNNERLVGFRVDKGGIKCYLETNHGDESPSDPADSKTRWIQAESSDAGS